MDSLIVAAKNGDIEQVTECLKRGVDVNAKDARGLTALHFAAIKGHTKICQILGERDEININAKDNGKRTALHCAACNGRKDVCQVLLDAGAYPGVKCEQMSTVLHFVAWNGHGETCKLLLDAGVDVYAEDNEGRTALDVAERYKRSDIVKLLKEYMNPDYVNPDYVVICVPIRK